MIFWILGDYRFQIDFLVRLLMMIMAQAIFKTVYEIICYPMTKRIIKKIRIILSK